MKRQLSLVLMSSCLFAWATTTSAQTEPSTYLYVATLTTSPGTSAAFTAYEMRIKEARERINDPRSVSVYQTRMGGSVNTYRVVIPFESYEELASWSSIPELLRRAYGDTEGRRIFEEGSRLIESVEVNVLLYQPDYTAGAFLPPTGQRFVQVVTTSVDPGMNAEYTAFLRSLRAAEEKQGIRRIRRTTTLGALSTYSTVRQFDSLADIPAVPGPPALLADEFGPDVAARMLASADDAVESRTIEVLELRADLSHLPD